MTLDKLNEILTIGEIATALVIIAFVLVLWFFARFPEEGRHYGRSKSSRVRAT